MASEMIGSFQTTPKMLFRITTTKDVKLRDYEDAMKKGSRSFDFKLDPNGSGMILPCKGDYFEGPNGMSLRPLGTNMWELLEKFPPKAKVVILPAGTPIPEDLILYHEHGDHYSLQTKIPIKHKDLNTKLTKFMQPCEVITKDEYYARFPIA